ncbi:MAG TPA: aminomethyl-transferring glycine dehydrogenase subunit GcvPA [bacterium]|jgi:glycine dehydrogenase subunit 1|nr:aminomethyl-transferring glycine dehydrogenase subunit GcvPA [bacterium]
MTPWTAHKYISLTEADRQHMLRTIGVPSVEDLFTDVPRSVRLLRALDLPPVPSDAELLRELRGLSERNGDADRFACFLGAGAYDHFIPSIVWHLAGRSEFYTAYTPYQAEIMQGELQAAYEYQSLLCALTGMEVSNASMYDGASATAEATVMARDLTHRDEVVVSSAVHPEYRQVVRTYTRHLGVEVRDLLHQRGVTPVEMARDLLSERTAALIVQQPNFFGGLEDMGRLAEAAHAVGALLVVAAADPVAYALLKPPGEWGADIVAGEGQPLGNHLNFGGPFLGMLATRQAFVRRMPGRLVGRTVDTQGRRGFVLTLQTREQHIRREHATSNICTNEALNALAAAIYMAALGRGGLRQVAEVCARRAHYAMGRLAQIPGFTPAFEGPTFHEFVLRCPRDPEEINGRLLDVGIVGGLALGRFYPDLGDSWLLCVTENRTREEIDRLARTLEAMR